VRSDEAEATEAELDRADRNWDELLGELRVVLTGVAVLFSVLLTLPFSASFSGGTFQRWVYLAALLLTAGSGVALIAPVAYHRIGYRREEKPRVVAESNRLMIVGLVLLALAIAAILLLVVDELVGRTLAVVIAGLVGLTAGAVWFVPALLRRRRNGSPT
jgi:MFS family permease